MNRPARLLVAVVTAGWVVSACGDGGADDLVATFQTIDSTEVAIEVCDGTVSMVDDDVDYWLNTVGQYCPWNARVIDLEAS